jgi:type IV pilus assembly protein PilO
MAVMADFAKLPRRQKVMLFAVIALVLGLLYNQFVLKKLKADLEEAQGEHDAKVAENSRLEHDIPEFQKLKARMVNLNRIIDENQKALPTEAELPAFFDMLNRKVLESGVEVVRSSQGKEVPIESFVKVPIDYEIQGSYVQIKKFFASLLPHRKKAGDVPAEGHDGEVDEKERIVSIENLSLSNPTVRNREIRLTAKFTASTYRQEEKGDAAQDPAHGPRPAPKPAAQPKVNPSPTGASTPAGAKAKTDDAMDKNQQRNNGASSVDSGSARMKGGL